MTFHLPRSFHPLCWLLAGWLAFFCLSAIAAEPTAVASLSSTVTRVGEPVQLDIKITNVRRNASPPDVNVDGLNISYLQHLQSSNMQIGSGGMSREVSVSFIYQVDATRVGEFTIPAVNVVVDGKTLQTQPIALKAESAGSANTGGELQHGILEIVIPKKTAYVGEMVPVEIRLSGDARVRWKPTTMPEIAGEGFTKQKLPEPPQERESRNGREMDVYVFRTAITPSRAGKITFGPVVANYSAVVPRAQPRRPRGFFDDVFSDPFFAETKPYKAHADPVEIEVKPLPTAGRPSNFSGAVGQFKFGAAGAPNRVKIGDPVTMKLTVSGRGNFDRMEAPALIEPEGWRAYPPSADFKADDDLGTSGTKTFSMAVLPETKKSAMPAFEFSYFDPTAENYVTLTSEPEQLVVEGAIPPPPVATVPAAEKPLEPSTSKPTPAQDILGIRYDAGGGRHTFEPLYARRGFLLAQAVPLAVLAAMLLLNLRRKDANARSAAAMKRQKAELLATLRGRELPDQEFLERCAEVVQLETALATGRTPGSIDAAIACASRQLNAETAEGVERIFNARAELLYAGMSGRGAGLSADERREVLATVENFERSRAHA